MPVPRSDYVRILCEPKITYSPETTNTQFRLKDIPVSPDNGKSLHSLSHYWCEGKHVKYLCFELIQSEDLCP